VLKIEGRWPWGRELLRMSDVRSGERGVIKQLEARMRLVGEPDDEFDEAMGNLAVACADQAERDHATLKAAVRHKE
jgi:hypothetical protein